MPVPPLDWPEALAYLAPRAIAGVESVTADGRYLRSLRFRGHTGYIAVRQPTPEHGLSVEASGDLLPVLSTLSARVHRMFDLDTDPRPIAEHLARDAGLAPFVAGCPALRLVGALDGFELAVRAVLGQAVSVRAASLLTARLVELAAEPLTGGPLSRLPLAPDRLADVAPGRLRAIGIPRARAECLLALARATATGELPELLSEPRDVDPEAFIARFILIPGIGPWTAHYVAMRALGWSDAFPDSDLGLRRAMGGVSPARLRAAAERWRPFRAYAARYLWTGDGRRRVTALTAP